MPLLLIFGAVCGLWQHPANLDVIASLRLQLHVPHLALGAISWHDMAIGTLALALPQVPLTLSNALIAVCEENNRMFPDRPVTERGVALSTGAMNLLSAAVGGVPMCHGAGGLAAHVAFGARTGGAPIILGAMLLVLAFAASRSIQTLFGIFPGEILGVVVFLAGLQLARGGAGGTHRTTDRLIQLITAAVSIWNVGLAFILGLVVAGVAKRWSWRQARGSAGASGGR